MAETDADASGLPPDWSVVYVPARPGRGRAGVVFETRPLDDGLRLALAFTSVEKLVASLGPYQPWVGLSIAEFRRALGEHGVTRTAFDLVLPPEAWRYDSDRLRALSGGDRG